jgi:hypothetical protein
LNGREISTPPATRRHERRWPAARQFVDSAAAGDVRETVTVPCGHAADEWTHLATQGQ